MPLHPQASLFLRQLEARGLPAWSEMPVDEARSIFSDMKAVFGEGAQVESVRDIDHADGFGMRVYHPSPVKSLPVCIYYHGGGWVLGDRDTHDSLCRHLASEGECVVVSVDYRRSPEFKFPVPLSDCLEAVRFVAQNATELNVDAERIAVGGDSAGGNLAAAVAAKFRDDNSVSLRGQLLVYPVLDANFETESYVKFAEGHGLTRSTMQWFWQQYVESENDAEHPHASPLRAESFSRLPPTHVITAEYDVLRDEGETYAAKLEDAGVATSLRRFQGMLHGFMHFASAFDSGLDARDNAASFLRKVLA